MVGAGVERCGEGVLAPPSAQRTQKGKGFQGGEVWGGGACTAQALLGVNITSKNNEEEIIWWK